MPKLSVQGVNPYPSPSIPQQSAAGFLTIRRRLADPSHPTVSSDFFISSHRICSHPVAVTPRDGGPARERICLSQVEKRWTRATHVSFQGHSFSRSRSYRLFYNL
ncbi:uncharacterized protein LOC110839142 isoform X2 [Zootermopsis nevadensis]|uniref:uncharacterized protein LOC110839142 isoform X2 n=1 Tax=Zootermopsis nevadensis TaxID=136037 RepID=UPI000B8E410B|nr:uncharacterized protein LOC110839142 isoform X2 [Zootermopsis nevadensis]